MKRSRFKLRSGLRYIFLLLVFSLLSRVSLAEVILCKEFLDNEIDFTDFGKLTSDSPKTISVEPAGDEDTNTKLQYLLEAYNLREKGQLEQALAVARLSKNQKLIEVLDDEIYYNYLRTKDPRLDPNINDLAAFAAPIVGTKSDNKQILRVLKNAIDSLRYRMPMYSLRKRAPLTEIEKQKLSMELLAHMSMYLENAGVSHQLVKIENQFWWLEISPEGRSTFNKVAKNAIAGLKNLKIGFDPYTMLSDNSIGFYHPKLHYLGLSISALYNLNPKNSVVVHEFVHIVNILEELDGNLLATSGKAGEWESEVPLNAPMKQTSGPLPGPYPDEYGRFLRFDELNAFQRGAMFGAKKLLEILQSSTESSISNEALFVTARLENDLSLGRKVSKRINQLKPHLQMALDWFSEQKDLTAVINRWLTINRSGSGPRSNDDLRNFVLTFIAIKTQVSAQFIFQDQRGHTYYVVMPISESRSVTDPANLQLLKNQFELLKQTNKDRMILFTRSQEILTQIKQEADAEKKIILLKKLVIILKQVKLPEAKGYFPVTSKSLEELFN